ncbi:uncharacterized protein LOC125141425 [Tachysurus ichikawai]
MGNSNVKIVTYKHPTLSRLQAYTPATSPITPIHHPKPCQRLQLKCHHPSLPIPHTALLPRLPLNTLVSLPQLQPIYRPSVLVLPSSFPVFGDSCEMADVLNFIKQWENYLDIRPLPSVELIVTLSTVLKGSALSWWKAEKTKVTDWQSFKEAFMDAFLPDDYWQKVGQNGKERCRKRPTDRPSPKNLAGVSIAQPHALSSLLLVLVTVKGKEVRAVLDTGSTYTLMQENL